MLVGGDPCEGQNGNLYWVQLVDKASTASDLSDLTRLRLRGCIGKYGLRYKVEGGVFIEHRYNRKNLAPSLGVKHRLHS